MNRQRFMCVARMAALWLQGLVVAVVAVVVVGNYFMDSYPATTWSDDVARRISPEGSRIQWRREGWATTRYWKWGISGEYDTGVISQKKVLIWGDSYVEALQVDDEDKTAQQVNRLWRDHHVTNLTALGIGQSGASAADYYFGLEPYERLLDPVVAHVFVVSQLEDFYPDETTQELAHYYSTPDYHFVPYTPGPPSPYAHMINVYHRYKLQVVQKFHDDLLGGGGKSPIWHRLRFRLGPRKAEAKAIAVPKMNTASPAEVERSLDFVFGKLREKTTKPILFIYCPSIPRINRGALRRDDEQEKLAALFRAACERHGFGYFDMGPTFVAYYEETHCFPRGFPNTRPGRGHFNAQGHALVAEAIARELEPRLSP